MATVISNKWDCLWTLSSLSLSVSLSLFSWNNWTGSRGAADLRHNILIGRTETFFVSFFQGRCTAFMKVLMDFQSVLTAVFGDYYSGEELSQWYLTWGSKDRSHSDFSPFFSLLIVAECNISHRMEGFVWYAPTTASTMTSHYLKAVS